MITSAEKLNNYGYHPIDPLPVEVKAESPFRKTDLLTSLPDETMRLAIGELMTDGSITYGPAKAGYKGKAYLVVLDYIKFDTKSFQVNLSKSDGEQKIESISPAEDFAQQGPRKPPTTAPGAPTSPQALSRLNDSNTLVPTYVGVGLRLTASVRVNEGSVDLGNLIALGAAAQAKKVSGTLVVQTLGISGPSISPLIPMPSEISESTIQNAILSLGAIKTRLYDENTEIQPRVVGVYNNLGGGVAMINTFISSVLEKTPQLRVKTAVAVLDPK